MDRYVMFFCCMLFSVSAPAQIHKWVDADGNVHYTDQPPPKEIKGQTLKIPSQAATDSTLPAGKSATEQEMEFRKRRVEQEEASSKQQQDEVSARESSANCIQATQQLNALRSGMRMARFNEQGERVFLDDNARKEAIEQAQKAVDSWCK